MPKRSPDSSDRPRRVATILLIAMLGAFALAAAIDFVRIMDARRALQRALDEVSATVRNASTADREVIEAELSAALSRLGRTGRPTVALTSNPDGSGHLRARLAVTTLVAFLAGRDMTVAAEAVVSPEQGWPEQVRP